MTIETDLQKILSADVKPYIAASRARNRAGHKEEEEHDAAVALVKPAHDRMCAAIAKALRPHSIEWWSRFPLQVNWSDDVAQAHFSGDVWPATKSGKGYSWPARPFIRFNFTPRNADEFRRVVAMLKAMADAATEGGL